jgi:hypothetical protein
MPLQKQNLKCVKRGYTVPRLRIQLRKYEHLTCGYVFRTRTGLKQWAGYDPNTTDKLINMLPPRMYTDQCVAGALFHTPTVSIRTVRNYRIFIHPFS